VTLRLRVPAAGRENDTTNDTPYIDEEELNRSCEVKPVLHRFDEDDYRIADKIIMLGEKLHNCTVILSHHLKF